MDTDAPDVMAAVSARLREEESRDRAAKDAGRDLLLAVLLVDAASLPDLVRLARERVERLGAR